MKATTSVVHYVMEGKQQEDCSCDSKFMIDTMPEVGQTIRDTYYRIGAKDSIPIIYISTTQAVTA